MNILITQVKLDVWTLPLLQWWASIEIPRDASLSPASVSPAPKEALSIFPKGKCVSECTTPGLTERIFSQRSILYLGSCMWNITCFVTPTPGSSAAGKALAAKKCSDIRWHTAARLKSGAGGSAMGGWNLSFLLLFFVKDTCFCNIMNQKWFSLFPEESDGVFCSSWCQQHAAPLRQYAVRAPHPHLL